VVLKLIHSWLDSGETENVHEVLDIVVGDSNGSGQFQIKSLFDFFPSNVIGFAENIVVLIENGGNVEQEEVDVVELQLSQSLLKVFNDVDVLGWEHLGNNEDVFSLIFAFSKNDLQGISNIFLILVDEGGINVAISQVKCVSENLSLFLFSVDLEGTKSNNGHLVTR